MSMSSSAGDLGWKWGAGTLVHTGTGNDGNGQGWNPGLFVTNGTYVELGVWQCTPGITVCGNATAAGTLTGSGRLYGSITNQAYGTLVPGTNGVGVLSASNSVVMLANSTNVFTLNRNNPHHFHSAYRH